MLLLVNRESVLSMSGSSPPGDETALGSETLAGTTTSHSPEIAALLPAPGADVTTETDAFKGGYPQFLERFKHPSAQPIVNSVRDFVKDFPSLTRPQAAQRVRQFLTSQTRLLMAVDAFSGVGDVEEQASEGLEKFVVTKLYKSLFRCSPMDVREDERVGLCIKESTLGALTTQFSDEAQTSFDTAVAELGKVDQYRAPRDKVVCMMNAFRMLETDVVADIRPLSQELNVERDESLLRRSLAALIVKASPPNFFSNLEFAAAFRHRLSEEESVCLRKFALALAYVTRRNSGNAFKAIPSLAMTAGGADVESTWLKNVGCRFRFEHRSPGDLFAHEVDELFDEYKQVVGVLKELVRDPL